jgi:hypothetical protein
MGRRHQDRVDDYGAPLYAEYLQRQVDEAVAVVRNTPATSKKRARPDYGFGLMLAHWRRVLKDGDE